MIINIGDRVHVKTRMGDDEGKVVDKLWSGANDCYLYKVQPDSYHRAATQMYREEELSLVEDDVSYEWSFEMAGDNAVIAILHKVSGDLSEEVARGHGHIIHEGLVGYAQASSYAVKKAYEKLNGGTLRRVVDYLE